MNLNRPAIKSGPLTLAELQDSRAKLESLAIDWPARRVMPAGLDQQGRHATRPMPAEACTDVGADTSPAALSMRRHRTAGRVALLLIAVPAVAAVAGIGAFVAQHWPG